MPRKFSIRNFRAGAILALAAAIAPVQSQAGSELEQHLRGQYKGKIVALRGFPQGGHLIYDSSGEPVPHAIKPGDWTVAGFARITAVDLGSRQLEIKAERTYVYVIPRMGFQLGQYCPKCKYWVTGPGVRIDVAVEPGGFNPEQIDAALSRVFLTSQDHFAELVPDYWKPCVLAASTGKRTNGFVECRFSAEIAAIPGVYRLEENPQPDEFDSAQTTLDGEVVYSSRHREGVTDPSIVSQPDPKYSEQAREARYQGLVRLAIIVDKTGQPRAIRVKEPSGWVSTNVPWRQS